MQVCVRVLFDPPTEKDWASMRSLAKSLTNDRDALRVFVEPKEPEWLVAEFTMPTEAQSKAVSKIDGALRYYADNRCDSSIAFPKTAAERERADRRAARRKARRRAR